MLAIVEVKHAEGRSWLTTFAHSLGNDLSAKLVERCRGQSGLFITLTYNRELFDGPYDAYCRSRDERHVRLFIRKMARELGTDLTGKWLCKMEFQVGGWVHWHIIILGPTYMDQRLLTKLWGLGHVWVVRLSKTRVEYLCKYVSKTGQVPLWILGERIRSVKVIRTSPGFWGPIVPSWPKPKLAKMPFYVSIGHMLDRDRERTKLRITTDHGRVHGVLKIPTGVLLHGHVNNGGRFFKNGRWLILDHVTRDTQGGLWLVDVCLTAACNDAQAEGLGLAALQAADLHLIEIQDPHKTTPKNRYCPWVKAFIDYLVAEETGMHYAV